MHLPTLTALITTLLPIIYAFDDSAPFLALVPSRLKTNIFLNSPFASAPRVTDLASQLSASCPSSAYVVVSQPGLSYKDLGDKSQPHWNRRAAETGDSQSLRVAEVVGKVDADAIARKIQSGCGGDVRRVNGSEGAAPAFGESDKVVRVEFAALPRDGEERKRALVRNDASLNAVLTSLGEKQGGVAVLFTASAAPAVTGQQGAGSGRSGHAGKHVTHQAQGEQHPMQVNYDEEHAAEDPVHVAWKRDVDGHMPAGYRRQQETGKGNATRNDVGLFETYNFLSPGIFMGIFALIILMSILLVGMNAVASIEVSYGSFNKDMVQAMTKAQKQQ